MFVFVFCFVVVLLTFYRARESFGSLVKMSLLLHEAWGGPRPSAFLTSSWMILLPRVRGPDFE